MSPGALVKLFDLGFVALLAVAGTAIVAAIYSHLFDSWPAVWTWPIIWTVFFIIGMSLTA